MVCAPAMQALATDSHLKCLHTDLQQLWLATAVHRPQLLASTAGIAALLQHLEAAPLQDTFYTTLAQHNSSLLYMPAGVTASFEALR